MSPARPRAWMAVLLLPWAFATLTAQEKQPRADLYGDPLPEGALLRLGTVRFRHDGQIVAVGYAVDGKSIVTVGDDETIRRWDPVTGRELNRIKTPEFAGLSPDGEWFLSYESSDPNVRKNRLVTIRNTRTNEEAGRFEWFGRHGDFGKGNSLITAFSRDGSTLAVGSYGAKKILLWDVAGKREIRQIDYLGLNCLALSPDGKTLLTGTQHLLWDVATGKKLKTYAPRYEFGDTTAVAFASDGKTVAFGGGDGSISVFDATTERLILRLKARGKIFGGAGSRVNSIAFAPDGKTLGAGSNDWTVRLWELSGGKQLHQLIGPTFGNVGNHGSVNEVAFSPDGKMIAAASNLSMLRVWETGSGKEFIPPTSGHRDMILSQAFSRDGKWFASGSSDLTIRIWDAATGREVRQLLGHEGSINALVFSPDGRFLISAGGFSDESLRWWDIATGKSVRVVNAGYSNDVAYSPDGKTIATAGFDGVRLWDASTGMALHHFKSRSYRVFFSSDARRVSDGATIWDLATKERMAEWKTAREFVLSPDWKMAAAVGEVEFGGGIHVARLLEVITQKEIVTLAKEKSWISTAVFSPDGQTLATAENKGIRLWETSTAKEISRLSDDTQRWHYAISFSPDGKTLAASNADQTILIWKIPPGRSSPPDPAPAAGELPGLWEKLARGDAAEAYAAMFRLRSAPAFSMPFLKERVRPVTMPTAERLKQLIAELDHDRFAVREKASRELEQLGEFTEASLRAAEASQLTPESSERVKALLARRPEWFGERLRQWRAVQVLEAIGTPEARSVLRALADGAPSSRLTQEARASLERLGKK